MYSYSMEYLFSHKKGNLTICNNMDGWMDLKSIMLSKINHIEKDKCCVISLVYEILKNNYKIELVDAENRLVVVRGGKVGKRR